MRVNPKQMTPGFIWVNHRRIDMNPVYQREAGVWSIEKKQLFVDSLLNGFDIPKLYFNELPEGGPLEYAVIDGKQRVSTILSFISGEFPLADDFEFTGTGIDSSERPLHGQYFSQFSERAQEVFKGVQLSVTCIQNGTEEDIENLFARLNNGEPLNSAESRNAIGGVMASLVRDIAERDFFKKKVRFSNSRFAHREVSCKLLYMEWQRIKHGIQDCPDLKKKYLDEFVRSNREMNDGDKSHLTREIDRQLKDLAKCFEDNSGELSKQSYPQFFFLVLRIIQSRYTCRNLFSVLKAFFPRFTVLRLENNEKPEEERDPVLVEFGRLTQQGTNDSGSMTRRAEILIRYFLIENGDVQPKDRRRTFNDTERYAIWIRSGKKCQQCHVELHRLEDMDADHIMEFVDGGATTLANGRCLCQGCNRGRQG